jgi:hypothetical protein
VNLQGSKWNTRAEASFTINLGVKSKKIHDFRAPELTHLHYPPTQETDCEWRTRIGHLLAAGGDKWWTLSATDQVEPIASVVSQLLTDFAFPYLAQHLDDQQLLVRSRSEQGVMFGEVCRAILLRDFGPADEFVNALSALEDEATRRSSTLYRTWVDRLKV